ncbi:MAG: hypothetical protein J6J51_06555 [Clostridia bacterium]|nr:hypothetical protein [Clostridia bacterium]
MKSRTSFCNGALLKRTVVKSLPLWGAYLLLWLLLLPLRLYSAEQWHSLIDVRDYVLSMTAGSAHMFGAAYGLASACMVFHWLYKSRSANFFGALPVDRTALFSTSYLAGLLFAVVPHLLTVALSVPAAFVWGMALLKDLAIWFAVMTLIYLFYYSLAVLVAMIVGNLFALPVLYAIVNFTAVVVESVVRSLLEYFVYGLSFRGRFLFDWASPLYYTMLQGDGLDVRRVYDDVAAAATDIIFEGWPMVLIMAAIGAIFAVIAYFLHKYRRMESAGDVIAVQHLKPVVLYCFTVGCSIVLGYLLANLLLSGSIGTEDFVGVLICMLVGAFVGYFGGQMLLHKSMRIFRKRYWVNWAVTCVIITAAMLCARYDLFGYAHYIPDLDEVDAVSLGYGGDFHDDPAFMEDVAKLHQACLDRQFETERMKPEDGYTRMYLSYKLQDDRLVEREYLLPISQELARDENSLIRMFEDLYNDPDYKVIRELPDNYSAADIQSCQIIQNVNGKDVWLSRQEAYDFLKTCLEPDLRESSMDFACYCGYHDVERDKYCNINVEIAFREGTVAEDLYNRYYFFSVTADAQRILAFAAERGIEPMQEEEAEAAWSWEHIQKY